MSRARKGTSARLGVWGRLGGYYGGGLRERLWERLRERLWGDQLGCMESIWGDLLGAIPIEQSNKRNVYIYFIFSHPSKR